MPGYSVSEFQLADTTTPMSSPVSTRPTTSWAQWLVLFGVALGAIVADQLTKAYAVAHLNLYESWMPIEAIRPVFRFTLTHNTGVAFGMFPEGGDFFMLFPPIVAVVILYYYRQLPPGVWLVRLALGLQLAGALGNFIDRVRQGYVVDFLHVTHWPVFNVADSCIVVGVGLLLLAMLYDDWRSSRAVDEPVVSEPEHSRPG